MSQGNVARPIRRTIERAYGVQERDTPTALSTRVGARSRQDARLLDLILASYIASHDVYGSRRNFGDLREAGERCGLHCAVRIFR